MRVGIHSDDNAKDGGSGQGNVGARLRPKKLRKRHSRFGVCKGGGPAGPGEQIFMWQTGAKMPTQT